MRIDGNETEKAAMREFHLGNRKEGLRLQEEKHAVIMATARNAWRFTGRMESTFQTVCVPCSMKKSVCSPA